MRCRAVTRRRRIFLAAFLVVLSVAWLPLNQPVEGPKLLVLSATHAVTTADLLSVVLVLLALWLVRPPRDRAHRSGPSGAW